MSIRQTVLSLPRIRKAGLNAFERRLLGDAAEEAVARLNGVDLREKEKDFQHWRRRGRPPSLLLPSVARDITLVLRQLGLPAGWWRDEPSGRQCLIVEILELVVADARKAGARIHAPAKYWQRVIQLATELQQPSWTIRRRLPAGWMYF